MRNLLLYYYSEVFIYVLGTQKQCTIHNYILKFCYIILYLNEFAS